MSLSGRWALSLILLAGAAGTAQAQQTMPADSLEHARTLATQFLWGALDSVYAHFSPELKGQVSAADLQDQFDGLVARAGVETEVIEEKFVKRNGDTQYWRTANFSHYPDPILFRWAFNPAGEIDGFGLGPASQAPPIDP